MTNHNDEWEHFAPAVTAQPEPPSTTFAELVPGTFLPPARQVVLGEVIASAREEGPTPVSRVEVGQDGAIRVHHDAAPERETFTEVTTDTFYADRVSVLTSFPLEVDLNAIADAVKEAQRGGGQTTDPNKRVYVGSEGELRIGDEATGGERIAEVTGDTFYSDGASLDAIARAVREAGANGGHYTDPAKRVFVNSEGDLLQGSSGSGERLSGVTADTFYSGGTRTAAEAAFVRSNMPQNTMRVSDGTYEGWHFAITNEFGDTYSMFLYYHSSYGV